MNVNDKIYRERVYQIVRQIPVGKVMTYGQLAIILGEGYTARTVGYVMHGSDRRRSVAACYQFARQMLDGQTDDPAKSPTGTSRSRRRCF